MANFISKDSIDEVLSRTDIVSVVGEYVRLQQRGNDWWGCCPFHNDKSPSFSVSADKKFYHCFGCNVSGTAITFLMEMEKMSYPEAIESLAKKTGVVLRYENSGTETVKQDSIAKLKDEYINLYNRVATSFHYMLMETESGRFAYDYITKRGLSREILEKFKLGYSPRDPKWLKKFLVSKNYSQDFLAGSGLFSKKYPDYAFFTDRLMFPIFDRKGDVVAMGGRFLRGDSEKSPKYLNSGDLIQYKKGSTLYAFNFAKNAIRQKKEVIFCEGYMDVIAYHQCGLEHAVAPLGTALTNEQIDLIKSFVDTVYLSFDSDGAGQNATKRAILMCRKKNIPVKVIRLEGGKDPAEIMLNFGPENLALQVSQAIYDSDWLIQRLLKTYPKDTPDGKTKASLVYFSYVESLSSSTNREACLEQFGIAYDISLESLSKDFENRGALLNEFARTVGNDAGNKANDNESQQPFFAGLELKAVMTAVSDDASYFKRMESEIKIDDLQENNAKELFRVMQELSSSDNFSVGNILNRIQNEKFRLEIIRSMNEYSAVTKEAVEGSIRRIKTENLEKKKGILVDQIKKLEGSTIESDKALQMELIQKKLEIDGKIKALH